MPLRMGRAGRRFVMTELDPEAESVELPPAVAHRVEHVLRMRDGESVELLDGAGRAVEGALVLNGGAAMVAAVRSIEHDAPDGELRLGVPLLKSSNTELAVQKATELGATDLIIYEAERSVRRPVGGEDGRLLERLTRVAAEAVEQCGGYHLPRLRLCGDALTAAERLGPRVLIPSTEPGAPALEDELLTGDDVVAAIIGPEGGFTRREVESLERLGGIQVSLGSRVLRAETAVMAIATLAARHLGWLATTAGGERG